MMSRMKTKKSSKLCKTHEPVYFKFLDTFPCFKYPIKTISNPKEVSMKIFADIKISEQKDFTLFKQRILREIN